MSFSKFMQEEILSIMQSDFEFILQGRLTVVAELDKFRWKEDKSIWDQKKGNAVEEYEIYFDGEFITFVSKNDKQDHVRIKILEGMKKAYADGKIIFNTDIRDAKIEEEAILKKEANTVILKKGTTPEEKIVNHAIKKVSEKGGKRVITK